MAALRTESTVALEHLDGHLKAILKLKLREFVHLSPWFNSIPTTDVTNYLNNRNREEQLKNAVPPVAVELEERNCPNKAHRIHRLNRRRPTRPLIL